MIFFLIAFIILLLLAVYNFSIRNKNNNNKNTNFVLKSFKTPVSLHEQSIPNDKSRVTINIFFYPDDDNNKEILVSVHSVVENKLYTYYQDGEPYQSSEIKPIPINNKEEILNYKGTTETEKVLYTSNENIKHSQSFNVIPKASTLFVLMKFRGKYKITIT